MLAQPVDTAAARACLRHCDDGRRSLGPIGARLASCTRIGPDWV